MNVSSSHLKHVEVSVPQLKKSKYLGLTKKNASLVFSQVAFTIHQPLRCNTEFEASARIFELLSVLKMARCLGTDTIFASLSSSSRYFLYFNYVEL